MQQNNSNKPIFCIYFDSKYSSEYDARNKEIELNVDVGNYKKGLSNQIRMDA